MRIYLIEITCADLRSYGVRCIASTLKQAKHDTKIIFLPPTLEAPRNFRVGNLYRYQDSLLSNIAEICSQADLVGISFMTFFFDRAVQLTRTLQQKLNIPIVWGGIHPTVRPEEALDYADMVCVGEGESAMRELAERLDKGTNYFDTQNIWLKRNGEIIRNPLRPLIQNLENIPFPDYDLEDHYVGEEDRVFPLDQGRLKRYLSDGFISRLGTHYHYKTMVSRGCPHRCTFCCVSALKTLYSGEKFIRRRSIDHTIAELEAIREKLPFINAICFFDDSFFIAPLREIKEFAEVYKTKIGLPFAAQGSPTTITEEKMKYLVEAGLKYIEMGIQTGSEKTRKMYNRIESQEQVQKAVRLINKYKDKLLPPDYHFILDNPWETKEDILATLQTIIDLPRPYTISPASLIFLPGTEIYRRAEQDRLIKNEKAEVYRKSFPAIPDTYLKFLIYLGSFYRFPKIILKVLSHRVLITLLERKVLKRVYLLLWRVIEVFRLALKRLRILLKER
jgi:radical SAM superfamily enzyme YgiQ (UPF0313 family)